MRRRIGMAIACAVALSVVGTARAGELNLTAGIEAQDTTWEGDAAGAGSLKVGYRWGHWSAFFLAKLGYAEVDDRVLQHLAAGGEYSLSWRRTRPYLRLGITHQHESPRAAIDDDFGTLLGYGNGIRHRGGVGAAVGLQLPFRRHRTGDFFVAVEGSADWMTGAAGPSWYWGGGVAVGFTYDLARRK